MQPSSVVFLAIVAMWVAYLLPQWIRRRETLAQSRGRDRHSEGLRVLRPRRRVHGGRNTTPLLSSEASGADGAPGRDGTAGPLGTAAPVGTAAPGGSPVPAAASASRSTVTVATGADTEPLPAVVPAPVPGSPSARPAAGAAARRPSGDAAKAAAARAARENRAGRDAARRRGRVLLALLSLTSATWLVAAVTAVPMWVALAPTALLVLDLAALRGVAVREAARHRPGRAAGRTRARGPVAPATAAQPRPGIDRRASRPAPSAAAARAAAVASARRRAAAAAAAAPGGRADELLVADGTWDPVPVPRPTYTMKPPAPRPQPPVLDLPGVPAGAPGATAAGSGAGAGVTPAATAADRPRRPWDDGHEWADGLDLDAVLARRRAVNG